MKRSENPLLGSNTKYTAADGVKIHIYNIDRKLCLD